MLNIPRGVTFIGKKKSAAISSQVSPRYTTRCLLQPQQRTLMDELGMIRTQAGSTIVAVHGTVQREGFENLG
jgi:hypothetical protein